MNDSNTTEIQDLEIKYKKEARSSWQEIASYAESVPESASYIHGFIDGCKKKQEEIDELEKEIASLKELIEQAYPYVEYAVTYSTPLSQKLSERWISEVETRRKK